MHDLAAARAHVLGARSAAAARGLPALADAGYEGAGQGVGTPVKQPADGRPLDLDTRTYNAVLRSLRCLGEHGFALLTGRCRVLHQSPHAHTGSATSPEPHSCSPTSNTNT